MITKYCRWVVADPDLANGIVPLVIEHLPTDTPPTTVSMPVATPKPRIVKLIIFSRGEELFSVVLSGRTWQSLANKALDNR